MPRKSRKSYSDLPHYVPLISTEPPSDCKLCERLAEHRVDIAAEYPDWWNAPVPAFGDPQAWIGIIGLAPGEAWCAPDRAALYRRLCG